jgi:hypothetical protein
VELEEEEAPNPMEENQISGEWLLIWFHLSKIKILKVDFGCFAGYILPGFL